MTRKGGAEKGTGLNAAFFCGAIIGSHPINDIKEVLVLVEPHFEIGGAVPARISRTPFNVEHAVR